jgi:opacity protein-like surface antigen
MKTTMNTRRPLLMIVTMVMSLGLTISSTAQLFDPVSEVMHIGLYGTYDQRYLNASFAELPQVPSCCQEYSDVTKGGYTIGLLTEFPVSPVVAPTARVFYTQLGGSFTADEQKWVYNGTQDSYLGTFRHTIDATVHALYVEPGVRVSAYKGWTIGLGLQVGYILSSQYAQREEIASPQSITYQDGSTVRNVQSGDALPAVQPWQFAINIGTGYDFAFASLPNLTLGPELNYSYSFTNIVEGIDWTTNSLRFGIAVRYAILRPARATLQTNNGEEP